MSEDFIWKMWSANEMAHTLWDFVFRDSKNRYIGDRLGLLNLDYYKQFLKKEWFRN